MVQAKKGDTVKVHYTGKLEDGTVFDSSAGSAPLEFKISEGLVIPGFDEAMEGMSPGESKTVEITPVKGYGSHHEDLVVEISRDNLPPEVEPEVGQVIQIGQSHDKMLQIQVVETSEEKVVLDANHPLAGKMLTFEIELLEIV
ncbi:MAG: FKBP-type peptidyl-prolyl cis-trans isomerase [Methanotrichaceae archaeon]